MMGVLKIYKGLRFPAFSAIAVAVVFLSCLAGSVKAAPWDMVQAQSDIQSFGGLFLVAASGSGTIGDGAQSFIRNIGDRAISFLGDDTKSLEQKKDAFRTLLKDSYDMKTIGRFALGRYWRVATPEQRKEYEKLFEQMIISVYSQRFSDYQGQTFETRGFRMDGANDTIVTSFIVPEEGPEVQVDWRVRYKDGHYKVVDVIVEGVSMSVTQRADFSSVIQRGGGDVQVLLTHLRGQ